MATKRQEEEARRAELRALVPSVAVRVSAGHDVNGNPKRGWLVVDTDGETREFIDEEYSSDAELKRKYGISQGLTGCTIELKVTPGTYRALKKLVQA